jgi:hypothetical protein
MREFDKEFGPTVGETVFYSLTAGTFFDVSRTQISRGRYTRASLTVETYHETNSLRKYSHFQQVGPGAACKKAVRPA